MSADPFDMENLEVLPGADPLDAFLHPGYSPDDVLPGKRAEAVTEAEEDGLVVIWGRPGLLLLDVDSERQLDQVRQMVARFQGELALGQPFVSRSRSGNYHVAMTTKRVLSREERVLLQGVLGSDPVRAVMDFLRASAPEPQECCLFAVPGNEAKALDLPPPPKKTRAPKKPALKS